MALQRRQRLEDRLGQRVLGVRPQRGKRFVVKLESACIAGRDHAIHLLLQLFDAQVAAVLDDELEPAGRAETGNRWRSEDRNLALRYLVNENFPDAISNFEGVHLRIAAIGEFIKRDEELAEVRAVGVEGERLPGNTRGVNDAIHRVNDLLDAVDDLLSPLQGGGVG